MNRQRDRETERQRDRETERQRDRETERQRDRLCLKYYLNLWILIVANVHIEFSPKIHKCFFYVNQDYLLLKRKLNHKRSSKHKVFLV